MLKKLDNLYKDIALCTKCPLAADRTNPVRDNGDPEKAAAVLVGEAPGANEVKYGIPFAGEAGKKLSGYLALAGLAREDVYITNVVRCRPTSNGGRRNRTPSREIPSCGDWLNSELAIIRPKTVVTLGNISLKWICGKQYNIGNCHGKLLKAGDMAIIPMYHPAAAIYRRELDELIRAEFQKLGYYLKGNGLC
ncbi:uracil-DNA glycosylase [Desulfocucumis palustris]|uniref:Type-4 uracil-DNA glycosylase n=1 Tax=Desulfocucumis palustris TaxID=1898651 RepID=A0A2L2XDH3_9FIRM|nr:uracil-DNA glycosylase [Desulfocucumis palustris]GBF34288.1 uracil-DNA glycosylase [Desulfocucumis palustris]